MLSKLFGAIKSRRKTVREGVLFLAVYLVLEFAAPRFLVAGPSMQPTFVDNERLIASRLPYLVGTPEHGDIVVFRSPETGELVLIKRVIGLPGDLVEFREGELYLNGLKIDEPYLIEPCELSLCPAEAWHVGPDEVFVMGDNRNHSNDSRAFGPIEQNRILGKALLIYWPPQNWGAPR